MGADPRFFERLGPLKASDIAALIGSDLIGDGDVAVFDVSTPDAALAGELMFLAGKAPLETPPAAGVAIVPDASWADALPHCEAVLVHRVPRAGFAQAAARLLSTRFHDGGDFIHASAQIAETARLAPGVIVGPDAIIGEGARIEAGAIIGPGVVIGAQTRIGVRANVQCALVGAECEISAGAVVGEAGFGLAYEKGEVFTLPHLGRVIVEDEATLGANATVDRGMLKDTRIGKGVRIDNLCHIGHNVDVGEYAVMAAFAGISGSTIIGAGAQFGGRVGIADHLKIGAGARLAADAAVMKDVPPGETWAGSPAQPIQSFMRETAWLRRAVARKSRPERKKDET